RGPPRGPARRRGGRAAGGRRLGGRTYLPRRGLGHRRGPSRVRLRPRQPPPTLAPPGPVSLYPWSTSASNYDHGYKITEVQPPKTRSEPPTPRHPTDPLHRLPTRRREDTHPMTTTYAPGSLVSARGREWVVLPESATDMLVLRPL